MSTKSNGLKQAVATGDIKTIVDLAPELDYSSTDSMSSVSLAMAMIECIMKKRRNDWLDEAVVCLLHIHSNVLDAPEFLNKLYIELLVNIKVKAAMHHLLSLDPDECDISDMESIILKYFDPSLFSHIQDQSEKIDYIDKHSYAALLHKTAFDGINGLIRSKEEVEQMRDIFENDLNRIEIKLIKCLRKYFRHVRNNLREVTDLTEQNCDETTELDSSICISDVSSSFLETSRQTNSLKKMSTLLPNDGPQSDVDVDTYDDSQAQFNLEVPDGLLQTTASQLSNNENSNTQAHEDELKQTSRNRTDIIKFFYQEDSQSQTLSNIDLQASVSRKRARKQTARKHTQPYKLKQAPHCTKVSPLQPKQLPPKHTQLKATSSSERTSKKQLNSALAKLKGRKNLSVLGSLKTTIFTTTHDSLSSKLRNEVDICSTSQCEPYSTQIIDVEGTQSSLFSTQIVDVEGTQNSFSSTQIVDVGGPEEVVWGPKRVIRKNILTQDSHPSMGRYVPKIPQLNVTRVQASNLREKNTSIKEDKSSVSSNLETVRKDIIMMAKRKKM